VFRHFLTVVLLVISFSGFSQHPESQIGITSKSQASLSKTKEKHADMLCSEIGACVRISADSLLVIHVNEDKSEFQIKHALKDHPMFGKSYNRDSLKRAQPHILFLNFDKFENQKQSGNNFFSGLSFNLWYWFAGILILFGVLLFNRYLMNFAKQSTNP